MPPVFEQTLCGNRNHHSPTEMVKGALRFVLIREIQKPKVIANQLCFNLETCDYQIIITSNDKLNMEEAWHEYNKRCNIENKTDELKIGLGFEKMSPEEMERNIALYVAENTFL